MVGSYRMRRALMAVVLVLGGAVAEAAPVRLGDAQVQLEAPSGWQVNNFGARMVQLVSPNQIKIDVFTPPERTSPAPVLAFLRDGPRRGLTWTPEAPVTIAGFSGSTQQATGVVEGTPTTFVQSWVTVRGRLVIFTVQYPTANAASAEPSVQSVLNSLRRGR